MTLFTRVSVLIFCCYSLALSLLEACQVPVFRYALARWSADKYELTVFSKGELTEAQQSLIDEIGDDVNLEVVVIDIGKMITLILLICLISKNSFHDKGNCFPKGCLNIDNGS